MAAVKYSQSLPLGEELGKGDIPPSGVLCEGLEDPVLLVAYSFVN